MLRELSVQNLALIEDVRVELCPGYCAWTGETGAGKSLLLTALTLVLGGKASPDLVREGKTDARASAVFEVSDPTLRGKIEALLGGPLDDDLLILTRRIAATGRGSAHANGVPVPAALLRSLGDLLIDLHGQHESRLLLDPDRRRDWLDSHGGHHREIEVFHIARSEHESIRRRRLALLESAERRDREKALLQFERDELEALDPRVGEVEELTREAQRLSSVVDLRTAASEGYALLYAADRSAQGLLDKVARRLESLGEAAPEFADAAGELSRLADETREIAYALRTLGQSFDDDPGRLDRIETRLAEYRRLASRFRTNPDQLAGRRLEAESRLASIERDETGLAALDAPLLGAWKALKVAAEALSERRGNAANAFAKAIRARLKALSLGSARLTVEVETDPIGDDPTRPAPAEGGADRVDLMFSPNPGEPVKPLHKVASGGELSRVTLAIKAVLAEADSVPTLIFDEVDTGVGGRLGAVLGKTLAELSKHHQVICVTHLPQIASFAENQWVIRKQTKRGRTTTTIERLGETERIEELAAMLRGDSAAESTRTEALAMLLEARSIR